MNSNRDFLTRRADTLGRIRIPFTVTREERELIKKAFLHGIESADKEKVDYIAEKLPRVIDRLSKSDESWQVEIAEVAKGLANLLRRDSGIPNSARPELVAALYYLCHPFEVIPDYVPGRGYADDALVLNTCVSRLRRKGITIEIVDDHSSKTS